MIKKILKKIKRKIINKNNLVKVYSHPRSGTHFLEAFIARNFYQGKYLALDKVGWGHWSNIKVKESGNPYGLLFGNHYFGEENKTNLGKKIYIYRDVRAVAYSVWKTENFINPKHKGITFSDFLKIRLDWEGSPARKSTENYNIIEHWYYHIESWKKLKQNDNNLIFVEYEALVNNPYEEYLKIKEKFFNSKHILEANEIDKIQKPVGLLPNEATKDSWKTKLTVADVNFIDSELKRLSTQKTYKS